MDHTPATDRLCKDCQFARPPGAVLVSTGIFGRSTLWLCLHPTSRLKADPDLVTGRPIPEPPPFMCLRARESLMPGWCGPEGNHWKPLPVADAWDTPPPSTDVAA
jgi:hypothetical protein